jgi:hypothetical protein
MWLLFFEIYIRLVKMLAEHDIRYCSWTYLTASIKMASPICHLRHTWQPPSRWHPLSATWDILGSLHQDDIPYPLPGTYLAAPIKMTFPIRHLRHTWQPPSRWHPLSATWDIRVITKLPNSEQSYKGKVKAHKYINRQNQSTTGKLWKP